MCKKPICLILLFLVIGLIQTSVIAAPGDLLQTILNPDHTPYDSFGHSVAALGDNILVSNIWDDEAGSNDGAVYLFDSNGILLHKFLNPDPSNNEGGWFGMCIATVGNNVLIGAFRNINYVGAAYLFDGDPCSPTFGDLLHSFYNPEPDTWDFFGFSVAALGDDILISTGGMPAGEVYLYDGSTYGLLQTFENPNPAYNDCFGCGIAAMGDNVLVGDPYYNAPGEEDAGAAYLFDRNGNLLQEFHNPRANNNDLFGIGPIAVGDNVLIGANWAYWVGDGSFKGDYVYLFDGSTGQRLHTFGNPTPAEGDGFGGTAITGGYVVVGNNILIGADGDDTAGTNAGAVYLFDGSTYSLLHTFLNPNPVGNNGGFGFKITAYGNNILIGSYDFTGTPDNIGAAYLFEGGFPWPGDFEPDGDVDFADLAVLAEQWLWQRLSADVAPNGGDNLVNFLDWALFANAWQTTPASLDWNPKCDIAPNGGNGIVDENDLAVFANQWLKFQANDVPIADIAPVPNTDNIVNMLDFAMFAENWLAGTIP